MDERMQTPDEGVDVPIVYPPGGVRGFKKKAPLRGRVWSLFVPLNHYTFVAQGAHLRLLPEYQNTAFLLPSGHLL